ATAAAAAATALGIGLLLIAGRGGRLAVQGRRGGGGRNGLGHALRQGGDHFFLLAGFGSGGCHGVGRHGIVTATTTALAVAAARRRAVLGGRGGRRCFGARRGRALRQGAIALSVAAARAAPVAARIFGSLGRR